MTGPTTHQQPGLSLLVVEHERSAAVSLTGVTTAVSIPGTEEDLGDGLEVGLVTILVGPDREGDTPQPVHLLPVVVGGAPAQGHGQCVGEALLRVPPSGQTDWLNVPRQSNIRSPKIERKIFGEESRCHSLGECDRPLESEHRHVAVEAVGTEVWMGHHVVDLELLRVAVPVTEVPLSDPHRELTRQEPQTSHSQPSHRETMKIFVTSPGCSLLEILGLFSSFRNESLQFSLGYIISLYCPHPFLFLSMVQWAAVTTCLSVTRAPPHQNSLLPPP